MACSPRCARGAARSRLSRTFERALCHPGGVAGHGLGASTALRRLCPAMPPESSESRHATFEKPSVADLRHAAEQLGMNPSMHYLNAVQDIVAPLVRGLRGARRRAGREARGEISARRRHGGRARRRIRSAPGTSRPRSRARRGGKLAGRRVALKDNICLAGVPMMIGAGFLDGSVPDIDATVVDPHPRRRRRDRRQGGVRILLRVRRQPHQLDRPGAESAQAGLHHRRLVVGQRRAGGRRRSADGDRRRPGRLDPHSGKLLRHRRPEADLRAGALHRHRAAGDHARHRRADDGERRRQRAAAGGDRRSRRARLAPARREGRATTPRRSAAAPRGCASAC